MKRTLWRGFFALALVLLFSSAGWRGADVLAAGSAFDKSRSWDGVNATIEWYVNGDSEAGYRIADAYDLYGLSCLVQGSALSTPLYYDANYAVILDSDGDGDFSDEVGYSEERTARGSLFDGADILLTGDIDLNQKPFLPIGASATFRGNFKGQGHKVKNLFVTTDKALNLKGGKYYYGLFGMAAYGSKIENFTIENEVIEVLDLPAKAGNCFVGGVAAYLHKTGGGTISNVRINGLYVRFGGDMSGVTLMELGAIVGHYGTTLPQNNVKVYCYEVENADILTVTTKSKQNFFGGGSGDENFTDCEVVVGHSAEKYESDGTQHYKVCTVCGKEFDRAACTPGDWKTAGEDVHVKTCEVCGNETQREAHSFGEWITVEEGKHYRQCACGQKADEAAHTPEWKYSDEEHWKACSVCGFETEGKAPHALASEWSQTADGTGHAKLCACGYEGEKGTHELTYTDNGNGTHKATCSVCSLTVIEKENHTWEWKDKGESEEVQECTACAATGETRSKHTHKVEKHSEKAPTCTEAGNPLYYTCSEAGCENKFYQDEACSKEYTEEQIVIAALGHSYSTAWSYDGEVHYKACTRDGCDSRSEEAAHTFGEAIVDKKPSSSEAGLMHRECTVCGAKSAQEEISPNTGSALLSAVAVIPVAALLLAAVSKKKRKAVK